MGTNSCTKKGAEGNEITEFLILKEAVENTNEAFITIDEHHRVLFFNKTAEKIFGYTGEEVIGGDLNTILTSRCSHGHRQAVAKYIETRKPKLIGHESEFTATRKNGEAFPAAISFSVAQIQGRLFFTALVRDMTETRALQQKLIQTERLAALGQVVAEITHEIKNPLMLIGGFAQQLKKTITSESELPKLNIIVGEVHRLENLLTELRELYLPKSMVIESLALNDLLAEVYSLTKAECERKNIRATLKTDGNAGFINGDKEKLKQVFLNLVKNAIEAIGTDGNLSIRSGISGDTIEVVVADDGPGIPRCDQEKVFTPFFTTKRQGSGLGLCISKRIIEEHQNCSIGFTSEEGEGTEVRITFPLSQQG